MGSRLLAFVFICPNFRSIFSDLSPKPDYDTLHIRGRGPKLFDIINKLYGKLLSRLLDTISLSFDLLL